MASVTRTWLPCAVLALALSAGCAPVANPAVGGGSGGGGSAPGANPSNPVPGGQTNGTLAAVPSPGEFGSTPVGTTLDEARDVALSLG